MTIEEKIGQMLMVWARVEFMNVNGPEFAKLRDAQAKYHLGGWGVTIPAEGSFLVKAQPFETAALINELQRASNVPLIFTADFERGLSMRLSGTTGFPHAMAFGATGNKDYAFQFGKITAEEARAIGVHWNFYPDADVNSNPSNPIINTRAFGEDPAEVSEMVKAYIAGARGAGMLTTAKHFPGHGDTDADTHLALARVSGDLERLEKVELAPFRAAIDAGVD
ncbi:MAG TPA: glycoside hydrolase family 3 N-terminal domain-containing protein, partial [Terriglobales bacterium]